MDSTLAILLRKTKLTETSLIVSWLTPVHGRIKTVAKGARQLRSRFAGVLDLFHECEIQFALSRKSDLHVLREAVLREPFEGIRHEYGRVALGGYFVELLELVTEPEHPAPELYDLLRRALAHINGQAPSRRALEHFETELTRLLGIRNVDTSSATAIGRVYHRLPDSRRLLVETLR